MGKKSPIVSVVIANYNRTHLVGRAIRSVLAQVFQDWEVIWVADGFADGREEVVTAFIVPCHPACPLERTAAGCPGVA